MTENVIWQPNKVSAKDRYRVLGQKGLVVWFTGTFRFRKINNCGRTGENVE